MPTPATEQKHTPTPYSYEAKGTKLFIDGADDLTVAYLDRAGVRDRATYEANAEFIVQACNSHAALVSALSDLLAQITGPAMVHGNGCGNDGKKTGLSGEEFSALRKARIDAASSALALATLNK